MEVITKAEKMIKEDEAEYILEELSRFECIPDSRRQTAMNVITKALKDIARYKAKEQLKTPGS